MHILARLILVALLFVGVRLALAADALDLWYDVPPGEGALVILVESGTEPIMVQVEGWRGDELDAIDWGFGGPIFKQYRLQPGVYTIVLPNSKNSPLESVKVNVKEGVLNYLRLAPYNPDGGKLGIQATSWVGTTPSSVAERLKTLESAGYVDFISTMALSPQENIIRINTEPPWPIPPPPK